MEARSWGLRNPKVLELLAIGATGPRHTRQGRARLPFSGGVYEKKLASASGSFEGKRTTAARQSLDQCGGSVCPLRRALDERRAARESRRDRYRLAFRSGSRP